MDANTPHFEIKEGPYAGRYEVPTEFTLGEQADMEELAGNSPARGPRMILALLFVAVRREHPTVRIDQLRLLTNDQWDAHGEEAITGPPAMQPSAENNGGGDSHESAETPATGGSPPSLTSTESSPGT